MQKMPKIKVSLLLKVACIFLVVGVAVLSLGFVLGPSGYLYFDHGLKTGNNVTETSIDEETAPFNQIVFDYSEFDEIRIETGESYKVELKSKTPYFTPNYTVKGGVLTIGAEVAPKKTAGHVLEITSNGYDSSAVITVPENAALSLVDIHELDTVEEYFGYSSIFFSRAYLTPKVTLNGLQVDQFSFACTADLNVQNCTVSSLTSELDSYAQLDYRVKNSTVNEAVLTADTQTGGLYLHGTDSAFTRLQTDVSQVSLEGGSVQSADISADSLDCENVQFTDLVYDVQSALLTGCTAETIDGTADNQNKVSLNGSRADYALDLQASPAVEVIEKTVPYTDALYIYGYNTALGNGWWSESIYPNINQIPKLATAGDMIPPQKGMLSDIIILADSFHANDRKPYYRFASETAVYPLHNNRANALFFDGHAEGRDHYGLRVRSGFRKYYNKATGAVTAF